MRCAVLVLVVAAGGCFRLGFDAQGVHSGHGDLGTDHTMPTDGEQSPPRESGGTDDVTYQPDTSMVDSKAPTDAAPAPDLKPVSDTGPAPDLKPVPDTGPAPDLKPVPDMAPAPDVKPVPDTGPAPDLKPVPDTAPAPDLKPVPDTAPAPDLKPVPDTAPAPDSPSSATGCAASCTVKQTYSSGKMVICQSSSVKVNQCNAASLCAPGWHLCTATEYLAQGGKSTLASWGAWLSSCTRDKGVVKAPSDAICSTCDLTTAAGALVGWYCSNSMTYTLYNKNVGVVTHTVCVKVGVNYATYAANWAPLASSTTSDLAVCCKP